MDNALYHRLRGLILGFHGCDRSTAERVLGPNGQHLRHSHNPYDWLGPGIYFWEGDPARAFEFARQAMREKVSKDMVQEPFVVGAVIDPGLCLNLMDRRCVDEVVAAHAHLAQAYALAGVPMPANKGKDRKARFLDKAVIDMVHTLRASLNAAPDATGGRYPPYDTVRAAFVEGEAAYAGAGFNRLNHIQLAVINPTCIKGYFRVLES